jgi:hypothetical protein
VVSAFGSRIAFGLRILALGLIGLILPKASKNPIFHAAVEAG